MELQKNHSDLKKVRGWVRWVGAIAKSVFKQMVLIISKKDIGGFTNRRVLPNETIFKNGFNKSVLG